MFPVSQVLVKLAVETAQVIALLLVQGLTTVVPVVGLEDTTAIQVMEATAVLE
jgi:hypothetical protein